MNTGHSSNDLHHLDMWTSNVDEKRHSRRKRGVPEQLTMKNRCPIQLVADYRFFKSMGGGCKKNTTNYLISLMDRVDKIFQDTEWDDGSGNKFTGMGFMIKKIVVHEQPTVTDDEHYNMKTDHWDEKYLLEVFSREKSHEEFCLSHLFTDTKFDNGVLGLAWVGSPREQVVGGICSKQYYKDGRTLRLNTGLSSSRNHYGHRIITREADLVTAHELGHNWGSEHDPDRQECSPTAAGGGSYIMFTYSISGYDVNNNKFSPCSVRSISGMLVAKAHDCFVEHEENYCGNHLVEPNEECDSGQLVSEMTDSDVCCTDKCRLRASASCSDKNSACCRDCRPAPAGTSCRGRQQQGNSCQKDSKCTGDSDKCPQPRFLSDGTPCVGGGQCRKGDCIPFCEVHGKMSCMCDTPATACKRCCKAASNGSCSPFLPDQTLSYGTPCMHGYCNKKGKCEKVVQDVVERFFYIVENINRDTIPKLLRDNVVGVVLVLSILFWLPLSCLISLIDRRKKHRIKRRQSVVYSTLRSNRGRSTGSAGQRYSLLE